MYAKYEVTGSRLIAWLSIKTGNGLTQLAWLCPGVEGTPTSTSKAHKLTLCILFVSSVQEV